MVGRALWRFINRGGGSEVNMHVGKESKYKANRLLFIRKKMGFKVRFEWRKWLSLAESRWEVIPECWTSNRESSGINRLETKRTRDSEEGGVWRRTEWARGQILTKEISKVWRSKVSNNFKNKNKEFELNSLRDREPMKRWENGWNMIRLFLFQNKTSSWILDTLKRLDSWEG